MRSWLRVVNVVAAAVGFGAACYITACAAPVSTESGGDEPVGEAQEAVCSPIVCYPGFCCTFGTLNWCQTNDVNHCGSCTNVCSTYGGTVVPACVSGICTWSSCVAGLANCDGVFANGCETSLDTTSNCGSCGNACTTTVAHAHATCTSGSCGFACDTNYTLVNGACAQNCVNDGGCSLGTICDATTHTCQVKSCSIDSDCGANRGCCNGVTCEGFGQDPCHCVSCGAGAGCCRKQDNTFVGASQETCEQIYNPPGTYEACL